MINNYEPFLSLDMKATLGPPPGSVIQSYIDSMSGMMKQFDEESVQSSLQARYHQNMQELMSRYSQMPDLLLWNQGVNFIELLLEARTDYVQAYYWSAVAVCGMVVESLCKDIAKFRTDQAEFAKGVGEKYIHEAINCLRDNGFFWLKPTSKLMHEQSFRLQIFPAGILGRYKPEVS